MIWQRIVCLVIGYVCGLFETGVILGKLNKVNIREHGSGNIGTTNMMRTMGFKMGLLTFFGDGLKSIVAATLAIVLFKDSMGTQLMTLVMYAGLGAILGHNFPFYNGFNGGKGIATSAGLIVALSVFDIKFFPVGLLLFFGCVLITKYVSLSSLLLMTGLFVETVVWSNLGMIEFIGDSNKIELYILTFIMMALSFVRHKENIKRLINGTERKISLKKED